MCTQVQKYLKQWRFVAGLSVAEMVSWGNPCSFKTALALQRLATIAGDQFGWRFSIYRSYSEFQKSIKGIALSIRGCSWMLWLIFYSQFTGRREGEKAPLPLAGLEGKVGLGRNLCKANIPRRLLLGVFGTEMGAVRGANIQITDQCLY